MLALSLVGSCLSAPFLFPILQAVLLMWMLPPVLLGLLGGWLRRWGVTLGVCAFALVAYVLHDLLTDRFGFRAIYDTFFGDGPPPGFQYFHSWGQLLDVTILVLWPGAAITVHAFIDERRLRKWEERTRAAQCERCGYILRGFAEPRCSECGQPFDTVRVTAAIRALDSEPRPSR